MLHVHKAVSQLQKEIRDLEAGKVSVDKLITEKQKQIEEFLLLIEKAHEEAGRNKETKPFKTSGRE